jgi:catechol 2,3-dioxygenase-like lactoylglutathione lyase family enzyme
MAGPRLLGERAQGALADGRRSIPVIATFSSPVALARIMTLSRQMPVRIVADGDLTAVVVRQVRYAELSRIDAQTRTGPLFHSCDFFTVPVTDLDRAVGFYRDRMGLQPTMPWGNLGQEFVVGPLTMALLQVEKVGMTFAPAVSFSVAWGVSDIVAAMSDLQAHGVAFRGPLIETKVCRMAFCPDSEGNLIMLHQRLDAPTVAAGGRAFVVTGIDFIGLPCRDVAGTKRFYEEMLGLTPSWDKDWPEYEIGHLTLCLYEPEKVGLPYAPVSTAFVAVQVPDVPAAMAALTTNGVTVEPLIDSGVCQMASFADPEGNMLMLHHRYAPEACPA